MNKLIVILLCVCILLGAGWVPISAKGLKEEPGFRNETLRMGATGDDVYELQGRLKYLGFYKGKIDGRFQGQTHRALRQFQSQFGLKVDGVVGRKTKRILVDASKIWAPGVENRIYKKGDKGGYVWELQRRLQFIGFYPGKVDGVFGSKTDKGIRSFQYRFGLKVDGKVGPRTKVMLWKATRTYRPGAKAPAKAPALTRIKPMNRVPQSNAGMSDQDIQIIAQAVHAEARGENYTGQVAVAAVILNRLESEQFPDSPSSIVYQPLAFEAVADGQINMAPDQTARKAVYDALNGWDPSSGALYYFNPITATSKWIWGRPQIKKIGKHIFTR